MLGVDSGSGRPLDLFRRASVLAQRGNIFGTSVFFLLGGKAAAEVVPPCNVNLSKPK